MEKSSEKENKKVQTDKQFEDNEVKEGKADSIKNIQDNDEAAFPYKKDDQYKTQEEFIDRNSETKDKT